VTGRPDIKILDVTDATTFDLLPPCADPRFDHRSCDYWENDVRGAKTARPAWWEANPVKTPPPPRPPSDNPFAAPAREVSDFNPFASPAEGPVEGSPGEVDLFDAPDVNPFAPAPVVDLNAVAQDAPSKLRLLGRGHQVFGSYAKILLLDQQPAAFAQFGPLSAYPRAQQIRELYPRLPRSPLPAVITCIATASAHRGKGLGATLVEAVVVDLSDRGFAAIEAYPDLTLAPNEAAASDPAFWRRSGFELAADDGRYPVMRLRLD
jgi:GNAT superfamily N-acetyltransferase